MEQELGIRNLTAFLTAPHETDLCVRVDSGEVSRGEKMTACGSDLESYVTEHALVCEEQATEQAVFAGVVRGAVPPPTLTSVQLYVQL